MDASTSPRRGLEAALTVILLTSGAAALLHESAWFRLLVPWLGAGSLPGAVVAAGALAGIALGSALGGWLSDRSARPSWVLTAAEVLAALAGAAVPHAIASAASIEGPGALAATAALLAGAALPWGVAIPAAVRTLSPAPERVGRTFARLYAWNTLGAVMGLAVGATVLFEAVGNRGTILVAAGCHGASALAALAIAITRTRGASDAAGPAPLSAAIRGPCPSSGVILLAAALVGAAGVGAQVAWTRRLTPVLGATFPVFAAVLGVHLIAIALGCALFGPRTGRRPSRAIAILAAAAAIATAATPFLLADVIEAARARWWASYGDPVAMLGLRGAIAAVLMLPGMTMGAAVLPWLVRVRADRSAPGTAGSGTVLAANTLGAAVGGLVVALAAIPSIGTAGSLVACGGTLALAGALGLGRRARLRLAVLGLAAVAQPFVVPLSDESGVSSIGALYSTSSYRPADVLTLHARDGVTASVLVRDRDGRREFWVEGSFESSTGPTDRLHLGLLAHLPLALYAARTDRPARVTLVGLGGGLTAQAAARHHPASLDVYELEPEVARAAERFADVGGGRPATATLHLADGRRAVLGGGETIDVLSSDPVHPAVAGSAFLYSREYFEGAMKRLSPEGVFVHWLPLYQIHAEELRLVLRTFAAAVAHPYVFLAGGDALLVAVRTPLSLSSDRLARVLASEAGADLRSMGFASPGRLLGLLALDPEGVRTLAGEGPLNTDDRLLLELRCGWRETSDPGAAYALFRSIKADPRKLLASPPDDAFERGVRDAAEFAAAMGAWVRWELADAMNAFADRARDDPADDLARRLRDEATAELATWARGAGHRDEAVRLARELLARDGVDPILRLDAAEVLARSGAARDARAVAEPYARAHPWPRARRLAGSDSTSGSR